MHRQQALVLCGDRHAGERVHVPDAARVRARSVDRAVDDEARLVCLVALRLHRVAIGRTKPRLEADRLAMLDQPARRAVQVFAVVALGGNAGETKVLTEFADEAGFIFAEVIQDILHGALRIEAQNRER